MKNFKTTLDIILKEFQEGVDFTVESKEKVIFHNEEMVRRLMYQFGEASGFFEAVKGLIPSGLWSYEESGSGWSRRCTFTFKPKNNKKDNNQEIERQKNELIEKNIKDNIKQVEKPTETFIKADIDGGEHSVERKGKDRFLEKVYYQAQSKEEKKQIIERNKKRREQEKSQVENSLIQDEKVEKETNQQNQSQKLENKGNNSKNIYYGIGVIFVILLSVSMITVWVKKKRKLK